MSLQEKLSEIRSIKLELDSMAKRNRTLRTRYQQLQTDVIHILQESNHPGVKLNDTAVLIKSKLMNHKKPKKQLQSDTLAILSKYGVHKPEELLRELEKVKTDAIIEKKKLEFVKTNPKKNI
jgi:hypothetical protein